MKIIIRDTGKEYPRKYKEGKEEYWEKALMKIWKNHMVKGVALIRLLTSCQPYVLVF